jgi:hypothetical protein
MDAAALQHMLDEVFDQALVHHGFTGYLRDYEVIVHATADPRTGVQPAYLRYLFRHCVEARCESSVSHETWRISLDDRLIDHEPDAGLDGYVWGVRWHALYPGAKVVPESEAARRWARAVGVDFHEVRIETSAQRLTLLFSDLRVSEVPTGYAPFTTG